MKNLENSRILRKSAKIFLLVSLLICFLSSFCASLIQTNGYSVEIIHLHRAFSVSDLSPASVTLDALIYKPKTATEENPAPVIFTIHGTINNKEMQDINAIELARRGFVVVAFDLVAHGNSQVTSVRGDGIIQLIEYACTLNYVDGSKVGVGGHSRGGGIATIAADYYNEKGRKAYDASLEAAGVTEETATAEQLTAAREAEDAVNRIAAVLSVSCTPFTMSPGQKALSTTYYGSKTSVGVIAGQYDEFFFKDAGKYTGYNAAIPSADTNKSNKSKYEWLAKDYVTSPGAARFIMSIYPGLETTQRHTVPIEGEPGYDASLPVPANNAEITYPTEPIKAGVYYTASGENTDISATNPAMTTNPFRIIYTPEITHPWAHFSSRAAANQIDFYYAAFGVPEGVTYLASSNQTWFVKELFNFAGLVGIVMFVIAFAEVILIIPFFAKLRRRTAGAGSVILEESSPDALGINDNLPVLKGWKRHLKFWVTGIGVSLIAGFTIRYFTSTAWGFGTTLMPASTWFNQNYVNPVVVWAVLNGIIALLIYGIAHLIFGRKEGERPFEVFKTTGANFGRAIVGALVVVFAAYLIEMLSSLIFHTDYRFWTLAFKTFETVKLTTILRYASVFAVFYVINAFINANNRFKNVPEWASTAITAFFNIFGIGLVMLIQYVVYFSTGSAWQWDASLWYVILFPILPILVAAAYIARKIYLRTGNIWFAGFVNAILMTIVMCANTSASSSLPYIFF